MRALGSVGDEGRGGEVRQHAGALIAHVGVHPFPFCLPGILGDPGEVGGGQGMGLAGRSRGRESAAGGVRIAERGTGGVEGGRGDVVMVVMVEVGCGLGVEHCSVWDGEAGDGVVC